MSVDIKVMMTWASVLRDKAQKAADAAHGTVDSSAVCYEVSEYLYRAAQLCRSLAAAHQETAGAAKRTLRYAEDALCEIESPEDA